MTTREARLNETFVALADTLVGGFDLVDLLHTLATSCVELLAADAAGIMLRSPGGDMSVVGSSDERTRLLELLEIQNSEGPCMECQSTGLVVSEPDLASSGRWPGFVGRALEAGHAAVDAVPLRLRHETLGAMNLFRSSPGPMPASDLKAARALADVATIGLLQARLLSESRLIAEQLQRALTSRIRIEQAKGVLAEQGSFSVDEAFAVMRNFARAASRTMDDVASDVISGRLDHDAMP